MSMYTVCFIIAMFVFCWFAFSGTSQRRRPGEPFDWTYRRPWWRPRWAFPDDR